MRLPSNNFYHAFSFLLFKKKYIGKKFIEILQQFFFLIVIADLTQQALVE